MFIQSADLASLERDTLEYAALSGRKGMPMPPPPPPPPGVQYVANPAVQQTINEVQRLQAMVQAGTHEVFASNGTCPTELGFRPITLPDGSVVCMREKPAPIVAAPAPYIPPQTAPMPAAPAPYYGGGGGGGGGGGWSGDSGPIDYVGGEEGEEGALPQAPAGMPKKDDDDEDGLPSWLLPAGVGLALVGAGAWWWMKKRKAAPTQAPQGMPVQGAPQGPPPQGVNP